MDGKICPILTMGALAHSGETIMNTEHMFCKKERCALWIKARFRTDNHDGSITITDGCCGLINRLV
jgi:hypothetical protein